MARPTVPTTPYQGVVLHSSDGHNGAVGQYGSAINTHNHDPQDATNGYGVAVPPWGPANTLYSLHGPSGGGSGNDWAGTYANAAAIPADPAETAVNPLTGLVMSQATPPATITAAYGIQAHIQRILGALARLKSVSSVTDTVQASPAPTATVITVANGAQFRTGVPVTAGAATATVQSISGNALTMQGTGFGTAPTAGATVTQKTGNWWDDVQVALLGNTPMLGNVTLATSNTVTAGQFVSTAVTPTPPMIVASSAKVLGLNVDLVDGFSAWQTQTGGSGGPLAAPTAPTSAAPSAGGTLAVGTAYTYTVVYQTAQGGTTLPSAASTARTPTSGNQSIALSSIPLGPPNVTARLIYRSANAGAYGLVQTIADNTTTTWTDTGVATGAAPPAVNSATYSAMLPALNSDGFLAPGYVEYDQAEAATWDTLLSGTSSLINSLNRIRNQVSALLTAAGGAWGNAPTSLVTSISGPDAVALSGAVSLAQGANMTITRAGNTLTLASTGAGGGGGGSGTVTSVAMTAPAPLTVTGSPITGGGTLALGFTAQPANTVLAGPTSGVNAAPAMRALVPGDLPVATVGALGVSRPDGTTIGVTAGVLSVLGGGGGGSGGAPTFVTRATAVSYTLAATDNLLTVTAPGTTISLPSAATAGAGHPYLIKNSGTGANTTISGATVDGVTSLVLGQPYDEIMLVSDGTQYWSF